MRLSARVEYGVRAMMVLALNYEKGLLSIKDIAGEEGISDQYLEQIFPLLKKTYLVESVRGAYGGYRLALEPSEISVGDIMRALEGSLAPTKCVVEEEKGSKGYAGCRHSEACVTRGVWEKLRDHITLFVDNITLADMVNWGKEGNGDCA